MTDTASPTPQPSQASSPQSARARSEWIALGVLTVLLAASVSALIGLLTSDERGTDSDASSGPRVAYLAPADASVPDLFLANLASGTVTQLTASAHGVDDFAVSPSGDGIAYTRNNGDGTADIWLVTVPQGAARPLTACVNARCSRPAWHPDGTHVVYQREDFSVEGGGGLRTARSWIVDVSTVQTRLLFDDPQLLGAAPHWSPPGDRVAVYDPRAGGIRVHNLVADEDSLIPIVTEVSGVFSPDGSRLVYPVLVRGLMGQTFYTHLEITELASFTHERISGERETPVEDGYASWSPDGSRLAVARRYLDERYTSGKQVYALDVATGAAEPLVVDAQYTHAIPQWDAAGRRVVYQRFHLLVPDALPEVWVYDMAAGRAQQVAANAFFPAWVP